MKCKAMQGNRVRAFPTPGIFLPDRNCESPGFISLKSHLTESNGLFIWGKKKKNNLINRRNLKILTPTNIKAKN